jgi:hypothetical protein
MTITLAYTEHLSETWLLERTYHAHLRNGRELSVPDLTSAMKQISTFSVPLSTWQEISQEEAHTAYRQGIPVLLYGEHSWKHLKGAMRAWSSNRHMRAIIYGTDVEQPEVVTGTEIAVCYLDLQRGACSNATWRAWFSSDNDIIFAYGSERSPITFLGSYMQYPYTTHYTAIAVDGHVHDCADRFEAVQCFETLPSQEVNTGNGLQVIFPQLCYYHEVTCPSGTYRLEFFGPRMDEQGYKVSQVAAQF